MASSETSPKFELVDYSPIAAALTRRRDELIDLVERQTLVEIQGISPRDCLSFFLLKHRRRVKTVRATPSVEYAQVLISFMRGEKFGDCDIDSFVSPVALKAIEGAFKEFLSSPDLQQEISVEVLQQLRNNAKAVSVADQVRLGVNHETRWLEQEIDTMLKGDRVYSYAGQSIDGLVDGT